MLHFIGILSGSLLYFSNSVRIVNHSLSVLHPSSICFFRFPEISIVDVCKYPCFASKPLSLRVSSRPGGDGIDVCNLLSAFRIPPMAV